MYSCWTCGSPLHDFESCSERRINQRQVKESHQNHTWYDEYSAAYEPNIEDYTAYKDKFLDPNEEYWKSDDENPYIFYQGPPQQHHQQNPCQYEDEMMERLSQKFDHYIDMLQRMNQNIPDTYIDPTSITSSDNKVWHSGDQMNQMEEEPTGTVFIESDDESQIEDEYVIEEEGYESDRSTQSLTIQEPIFLAKESLPIVVSCIVGEVVENNTSPCSFSFEEPDCLPIAKEGLQALEEFNLLLEGDVALKSMEETQSLEEHIVEPFVINPHSTSTPTLPTKKTGEEDSTSTKCKEPLQVPLSERNNVEKGAQNVRTQHNTLKRAYREMKKGVQNKDYSLGLDKKECQQVLKIEKKCHPMKRKPQQKLACVASNRRKRKMRGDRWNRKKVEHRENKNFLKGTIMREMIRNCKVRVRAYPGNSFGKWSESPSSKHHCN